MLCLFCLGKLIMGMNSQAHLVYGYDLGGEDKGWNFTKRETKHLHWMDTADDDDENDFPLQLMEVLLRDAGWIETDWRTDATYFKRKAELKNSLGVDVACCGSYDFSSYLLHTKKFSVEWGAD